MSDEQTAQDTTQAAAETKATEVADQKAPTQAPVVPEKYDLKLSEGSPLSAEYIEKFQAEAKARGYSNEQAQAQLDRDAVLKTSFVEEQKQTLKVKADEWFEQAKSDKEIGGEHFKENVEQAKRALDKFAGEPLKKFLNDSGLGNNPELIRTFMKIGKEMADDKLVVPGSQTPAKRSIADQLYPTTKAKE